MASISTDGNGNRTIQFVQADGSRTSVRLGKVQKRVAEQIKVRMEVLIGLKRSGTPFDAETSAWVDNLEPWLAEKLAKVDLIPKPDAKPVVGLSGFLTAFLDGRNDLKPATKIVQGQVVRDLSEFFGAASDVAAITPGNCDNFKQWLIGRKLAPTTVHKRLQVARSFFHAMKRRKLIVENPFEGIKSAATGIKERQRFVTREEITRVLDACPDIHWRVIVSLSRYGGLRCPSEVLSLRWEDINWATGRILVTSPKTEHHHGKASRTIPLFPELRSILTEAAELAPEGAEYVVDPRYRAAAMSPAGWLNANLRTSFEKIVRRAGLSPWPRLFHNLRASRETELVERFPIQTVTAWLGNTPSIAMKHYLMTTDGHFDAAVRGDEKAVQIPVQQPSEMARNDEKCDSAETTQPSDLPRVAKDCGVMQNTKVAGTGFESPSKSQEITRIRASRGADSGAVGAVGSMPPDLALVCEAWGTLPEATREAIVETVRTFHPELGDTHEICSQQSRSRVRSS